MKGVSQNPKEWAILQGSQPVRSLIHCAFKLPWKALLFLVSSLLASNCWLACFQHPGSVPLLTSARLNSKCYFVLEGNTHWSWVSLNPSTSRFTCISAHLRSPSSPRSKSCVPDPSTPDSSQAFWHHSLPSFSGDAINIISSAYIVYLGLFHLKTISRFYEPVSYHCHQLPTLPRWGHSLSFILKFHQYYTLNNFPF